MKTALDNIGTVRLKGFLGATLPIGQHYANPEGTNPPFVSFCDYASAGNEWNRSNSYRTWLPIERGHAE